MIRLERVFKRLEEHETLKGVDLIARGGEITVVTGPQGAGKTTLARVILGSLRADSGSVVVMGRELGRLSIGRLRRLRRSMGFVLHDPLLLPWLTVAENVALPLDVGRVPRRARPPRVMSALARLGVDGLATRHPASLSEGQARMVALARALVHSPKVVVADDPCAGLDREATQVVVDALARHASQGAAVLVFARTVPEAKGLAGAHLVMDAGLVSTRGRLGSGPRGTRAEETS